MAGNLRALAPRVESPWAAGAPPWNPCAPRPGVRYYRASSHIPAPLPAPQRPTHAMSSRLPGTRPCLLGAALLAAQLLVTSIGSAQPTRPMRVADYLELE